MPSETHARFHMEVDFGGRLVRNSNTPSWIFFFMDLWERETWQGQARRWKGEGGSVT